MAYLSVSCPGATSHWPPLAPPLLPLRLLPAASISFIVLLSGTLGTLFLLSQDLLDLFRDLKIFGINSEEIGLGFPIWKRDFEEDE